MTKTLLSCTIASLLLSVSATTARAEDAAGGIGVSHKVAYSFGIIHGDKAASAPEVPDPLMPVTEPPTQGANMFIMALDFAALMMPSTLGNRHGLEGSLGMSLFPFDIMMQAGTSVTFLEWGEGNVGSGRIGGGFGMGLTFRHGYGYLRGRAAMVIAPSMELEGSVQWIPEGADYAYNKDQGSDFEDLSLKTSLYLGKGEERAWMVYGQYFERDRRGHDGLLMGTMESNVGEIKGVGAGVGIAY